MHYIDQEVAGKNETFHPYFVKDSQGDRNNLSHIGRRSDYKIPAMPPCKSAKKERIESPEKITVDDITTDEFTENWVANYQRGLSDKKNADPVLMEKLAKAQEGYLNRFNNEQPPTKDDLGKGVWYLRLQPNV